MLARVAVSLFKRLPDRVLLELKMNIQVTRKMDYARHDIWLNIDSKVENDVRLVSCQKEPETVAWIEDFFREGDVFYDVGANVGAYSLVAAKFLGGKVKVYAFEPSFLNFPQLCKNIITNCCQDSIVPFQIALSDKTAIDVFNYHNLTPGGAIHTLGRAIDYKGDEFQPLLKQPVLAMRLDEFTKYFRAPPPNHMKVDVDGIDFQVLQGAEEALAAPSLKTVIVEIKEGDAEAANIIGYLSNKGLKFHSKHGAPTGGDCSPLSGMYNYIFCRGT